MGGRRGHGQLCRHACDPCGARRDAATGLAVSRRSGRRRRDDGLSLVPDPRPHPGGLLQGLPPQQLGRRRDLRRNRLELLLQSAVAMSDAGRAITRFDFAAGGLRGTHLTLYPNCLVHRGYAHLETLPLASIASVRVAFERDERKLGWGAVLVIIALLLLGIPAPPAARVAAFAGGAAVELAAGGTQGVGRALQGLFRAIEALANALPLLAMVVVLGGIALGVLGWLGSTTRALTLAGVERVYPIRGRDPRLLDFAEALSERVVACVMVL